MPEVDESFFLEAAKQLVLTEKEWIPRTKGASLYIRPTMIATEAALGVQIPTEFLFYIIVCPVGAYYPEGFNPTKIYVSEDFIRSAPGGTGATKAGANYAISLYGMHQAHEMGYTQVLWLDAVERRFIEEVGTSNIFFVIDGEIITPPLEGTILPGVIRNSVIQLAQLWNIKVAERRIDIHDVVKAAQNGTLQEAFASGTAAVISPVGHIYYRGAEHEINGGRTGALAQKFYDELLAIQYGTGADHFHWRMKIA
jgi:branched-chain amino acid aminotransferase